MGEFDVRPVREDAVSWAELVKLGAWSALVSVAMIVLQIVIYLLWSPPDTTVGFYELLVENPLYGLITLDVLYVVSNVLAFLVYLALAVVLWRVGRSAVVVALGFGVLGMAAYMASIRPVEMLSLARAHEAAGPAERLALVAVGDGMLATWMGSAFDIYYLFNLVTLLVFAVLMYRSVVFSRATALWALAAALLMAVPSNFGTVGLLFALASLVPWSVFAVLAARRLLELVAERRPLRTGIGENQRMRAALRSRGATGEG